MNITETIISPFQINIWVAMCVVDPPSTLVVLLETPASPRGRAENQV